MKKIIKCLPILTLSTLPLIAVKCVKKELTKEELEKILKFRRSCQRRKRLTNFTR